MVHLRLLLQIIILSRVFNICTPECIMSERGLSDFRRCTRYRCDYSKRIYLTSDIFQCTDTTITEIYESIEDTVNPKIKIYVKNSNIAALEPNSESWNSTIELNFDNTNTSQIDPDFFEAFDNLAVLGITNNQLKEIDGVFRKLSSITKLNLSSNAIENLTQNSFSGLFDLEMLDLSNNKISVIDNNVFKDQTSLEQVILSHNHLKYVGDIFSHSRLLKQINLSKNRLIAFNLTGSTYLRNLDLSNNFLENITNIAFISMRSRPMYYYDDYEYIYEKTTVNVSYNLIKLIDTSICNTGIQVLDLSNNKISEISRHSFQNGTHLEYLHLQHNNLKAIPIETFGNITNIKYLDLSFNTINEISFGLFNYLNKLTYLDLSDNNMTLDFHTLVTLKSLKTLKFQNNNVENFDPEVLTQRFEDLSYVSLGNNLWNCSALANTIHLFKKKSITLLGGNNTSTSNILGYTCTNNKAQKEEDITFDRDNQVGSQLDNRNKEISMQTFFDGDFKDTAFYKFFENFAQQPENKGYVISDGSKNAFIQYLNENFTETKFYKYLENISSGNTTFLDENIKKMLLSLNKVSENNKNALNIQSEISENIKSLLIAQNATLNKFVDILNNLKPVERQFEPHAQTDQPLKNDSSPYQASLVIGIVFLILILLSILSLAYFIFRKLKRAEFITNEQVQLM